MGILTTFLYVCMTCIFFNFAIRKLESARTAFLLKLYCIFMLPFAILALIRSVDFVDNVLGNLDKKYLIYFLNITILILCFCIFILKESFAKTISHKVYYSLAGILVAMVFAFPFVSLVYATSLRIFSIWGGVAASFYGLSQLIDTSKEPEEEERKRTLNIMLTIYVIVSIWMLYFTVVGITPGM